MTQIHDSTTIEMSNLSTTHDDSIASTDVSAIDATDRNKCKSKTKFIILIFMGIILLAYLVVLFSMVSYKKEKGELVATREIIYYVDYFPIQCEIESKKLVTCYWMNYIKGYYVPQLNTTLPVTDYKKTPICENKDVNKPINCDGAYTLGKDNAMVYLKICFNKDIDCYNILNENLHKIYYYSNNPSVSYYVKPS